MNIEKRYNKLASKVLIKRTLCYEGSYLTPIDKNAIVYKNRYYYYNGILRILEKEAEMLGVKLIYDVSELIKYSWRDECPKG